MNNTLKNILGVTAVVFLFFVAYIAIQVSLNNITHRATVISGVISMIGGAVGAFGAYKAAVWQTKKALEYDKELRTREKKTAKLEELKNTFVNSYLTLSDVYKKITIQQDMVNTIIEKRYTVFKKENFITSEIENELVKGLMQLQSFKFIVMNNMEYLPVRIDSLEVITAIQRMIKVLDNLQDLHKLMIGKDAMGIEEFNGYWLTVIDEYESAKKAMQTYVFDTKKYIVDEIQGNE
ncbi:MAG: hypothetical protein ABTA16_03405 [Niallia sp.]